MTYTQIALLSVVLVIIFDLYITKSRMLTRKSFWNAYGIMLFFQLITNWWLTSRGILTYDEDVIIGLRIASAPAEDLLFGFSMITMVISLWIYWGRKGIQRTQRAARACIHAGSATVALRKVDVLARLVKT